GSTKLWEQYPDAMRAALARHNHLLHRAIESHHGYVFKTLGDAFCAAFVRATDAVAAAFSLAEALQDERWETPSPLPVRVPPLLGLGAYPNNLPMQLTSFIGREKAMAEIKELLGCRTGDGRRELEASVSRPESPVSGPRSPVPDPPSPPARLLTLTGSGGCG